MSTHLFEQLQASLGTAYRLERELGGGGMSRVFLAQETALGRPVVVKVLLPELAAGVSVDRFRREIQLAAQLQHPHIVPLLSAGEFDGLPYFTMPFISGESLRVKLARTGELPVNEAVRILRDVVSALVYAHQNGVMHRDVKPDNVLITGGVAVVTDFGVATAISVSTHSSAPTITGLTSLGMALGTPNYMAPEQASGDPQIDHRADIYALGVMAYEMVAGRTPFAGRSTQAVLAAHVIETPEPVERLRPSVPAPLAVLVMQCLAKRPADRPQSASDILQVLDAIGTPTGGIAPTTVIAAPPTIAAGSRRAWLVPTAAAIVLLAIGLFGLYRQRQPSTPSRASAGSAPTSPAQVPAVPRTPGAESLAVSPAPPQPPAPGRAEPSAKVGGPPPVPKRRAAPPRKAEPSATDDAPPPMAAAPSDTTPVPPVPPESQPEPTPPAAVVPPIPEPVAPAPVPSPAATAPTAPPRAPPADPRPRIHETVAAFASAVESRSVDNLRRVYPGMTAAQQRGWEQFFETVRNVKAQLSVAQLEVVNNTAEARISGTYAYLNSSTGRIELQPVAFRATLRQEDEGWRIIQVR